MADYHDLEQKLNVVNQQWLTSNVHYLRQVASYQDKQMLLLGILLCGTIGLVLLEHHNIEKRFKELEHAS